MKIWHFRKMKITRFSNDIVSYSDNAKLFQSRMLFLSVCKDWLKE